MKGKERFTLGLGSNLSFLPWTQPLWLFCDVTWCEGRHCLGQATHRALALALTSGESVTALTTGGCTWQPSSSDLIREPECARTGRRLVFDKECPFL